MRKKISIFLIFICGILVYANSLTNQFQFDDHRLLGNIKEIRNIRQIITFPPGIRVLSNLTFFLNYRLGKLNVFSYHLVNIFVHILNATLVYWIVFLLTADYPPQGVGGPASRVAGTDKTADVRRENLTQITADENRVTISPFHHFTIPLFTALLFLVHPLSTEPVNYIIARSQELAVFFSFTGLLFFILYISSGKVVAQSFGHAQDKFIEPDKSPACHPSGRGNYNRNRATTGRKKIYLFATGLSVFFAFYSKEVGLLYALTGIFLYWYIFSFSGHQFSAGLTQFGKRKLLLLLLFFSGLIYLFFLSGILANIGNRLDITLRFVGSKYFLTENRVFLKYLKLLFLPFGLAVDRAILWSPGIKEIHTLFAIIFNLFILSLAFYLRKKNKIISFSLFCIILFHLPYFFLTSKELIVEYRTYPMIFGFALFTTWTINQFLSKKKVSWFILFSIIILFSILTILRNFTWRNGITLWADAVKKSPNNARAHNNLGLSYHNSGFFSLAIKHFEEALRLDAHSAEVYNNLGSAYSRLGKFDQAIACYLKGLKIRPGQTEIHYNLGEMYRSKGLNDLALQSYKEALRLNPKLLQAKFGLGIIYAKKGKYDLALKEFKEIIEAKPDDAIIYNVLGNTYDLKGEYDKALIEYEKAINLQPDYAQAYYNSGITYEKKKLFPEAIAKYKKAIELKSDYTQAYNNLGNVYYKQDRYEEAIAQYEKALQIEPNFVEAKNNLEEVRRKSQE